MNIEILDYADIDFENIDLAKVNLANKIIEKVRPLVDDLYLDKNKQVKALEEDILKKRSYLHSSKTRLENKITILNQKKKLKKLVERIEQLNSFGMLYGDLKNNVIKVLKNLDSIDEESMNKYLQMTMEIVNKRISK